MLVIISPQARRQTQSTKGNTTFPGGGAPEVLSIWQETSINSEHKSLGDGGLVFQPAGQGKPNSEEALWWKYIVENKYMCHWRGSHTICSSHNLDSIILVSSQVKKYYVPVTNCCISFGVLSNLCKAHSQTIDLSKQTEQTDRGVFRTWEWGLSMLQKQREWGKGQGLFSPRVEMNASEWRWMGQETWTALICPSSTPAVTFSHLPWLVHMSVFAPLLPFRPLYTLFSQYITHRIDTLTQNTDCISVNISFFSRWILWTLLLPGICQTNLWIMCTYPWI